MNSCCYYKEFSSLFLVIVKLKGILCIINFDKAAYYFKHRCSFSGSTGAGLGWAGLGWAGLGWAGCYWPSIEL